MLEKEIDKRIKNFYVFSDEFNRTEQTVYDNSSYGNKTEKTEAVKHIMKKKKELSECSVFNSIFIGYLAYWMVMIPVLYFAGMFVIKMISMVINALYN